MPVSDQSNPRPVELSVVIPAFNAADTIQQQLRALLGQEWDGEWEIVLADNGSSDGTAALAGRVCRAEGRLNIVDASARTGAAHARNQGVTAAQGHLIAFCDADDVVADGWLAAVGDELRNSSFVTGPQDYGRLNPPWLHGLYGTLPARELQTFGGIFPFGPTANLGIRRNVFERVGGFDESISVFEDLDLCLRLWLAGVELKFIPDAVVHYRYRSGLRPLWKQAITYGAASPAIARRLAEAGKTTPPRWQGLRTWAWLLRRSPMLWSSGGRARWVVVAGGSVGRIIGSIRSRYLLL